MDKFQKILSNLTYEGVKVVKAAGYNEFSIGNMPSWFLMTIVAKLPTFLTRRIFQEKLKKMVISSMAQDVIQKRSGDSELDTINGQIVKLAEKNNIDIPFNKSIYELCKVEFAKDEFVPMSLIDVWDKIKGKE